MTGNEAGKKIYPNANSFEFQWQGQRNSVAKERNATMYVVASNEEKQSKMTYLWDVGSQGSTLLFVQELGKEREGRLPRTFMTTSFG